MSGDENRCGGAIKRLETGCFRTTEFSGHYGKNWTDEKVFSFLALMKLLSLPVLHIPWDHEKFFNELNDQQCSVYQNNFLRKFGGNTIFSSDLWLMPRICFFGKKDPHYMSLKGNPCCEEKIEEYGISFPISARKFKNYFAVELSKYSSLDFIFDFSDCSRFILERVNFDDKNPLSEKIKEIYEKIKIMINDQLNKKTYWVYYTQNNKVSPNEILKNMFVNNSTDKYPRRNFNCFSSETDAKRYAEKICNDSLRKLPKKIFIFEFSVGVSLFIYNFIFNKDINESKLINTFEYDKTKKLLILLHKNDESIVANSSMRSSKDLVIQANFYGFKCANVKGDGNCFFHALAHQFKNITNEELRQKAIDEIQQHLAYYQPFINDQTPEEFINEHLKQGAWVEESLIRALSRALNITIVIIRSDGALPNIFKHTAATAIVYLGYEIGFHYQSLVENNIENQNPEKNIQEQIVQAEFDDSYYANSTAAVARMQP